MAHLLDTSLLSRLPNATDEELLALNRERAVR